MSYLIPLSPPLSDFGTNGIHADIYEKKRKKHKSNDIHRRTERKERVDEEQVERDRGKDYKSRPSLRQKKREEIASEDKRTCKTKEKNLHFG